VNNEYLGLTIPPFQTLGMLEITFNQVFGEMFGYDFKTNVPNFDGVSNLIELHLYGQRQAGNAEGDALLNCTANKLYSPGNDINHPERPNPDPIAVPIYKPVNLNRPEQFKPFYMKTVDEEDLEEVYPKMIHVHFNGIENNPTVSQCPESSKVLMTYYPRKDQEWYVPETVEYHRLEKIEDILYRMKFQITDENYKLIQFTVDDTDVWKYKDITTLRLHFRKIGLSFQGTKPKDIPHKLL